MEKERSTHGFGLAVFSLVLLGLALVGVGGIAWAIAGFERGIISALLLGYTVFVGGVVFPTLASFLKDRVRIAPSVAMTAVIVGGATAVLGTVRDGTALTGMLGPGGGLLIRLLGPRYPALLPVLLSLGILALGATLGRAFSGRTRTVGE